MSLFLPSEFFDALSFPYLVEFAFLSFGVSADHHESVSGIYLLRKNVEVEILVLMRIIHLSKSRSLQQYTLTQDKISVYRHLSRYIRLMSGVQALLHHSLANKASCNTCFVPAARCA